MNGVMIKKGTTLYDAEIRFESDKNEWTGKSKSLENKKERKQQQLMINKQLPDNE
jgi:hypothetical protein